MHTKYETSWNSNEKVAKKDAEILVNWRQMDKWVGEGEETAKEGMEDNASGDSKGEKQIKSERSFKWGLMLSFIGTIT